MDSIKKFFSTIWKYWKKFGEFMGNVVGRVFLTILYLTIVVPFGIPARLGLFGDLLDMSNKVVPAWKERKSPEKTIEAAYNQF